MFLWWQWWWIRQFWIVRAQKSVWESSEIKNGGRLWWHFTWKSLHHAIWIRNCYLNVFTSAQLAAGFSSRVPSTFDNKLPALEGITNSELMSKQLNVISAACTAFAQAEISNKVWKVLTLFVLIQMPFTKLVTKFFTKFLKSRDGKEKALSSVVRAIRLL